MTDLRREFITWYFNEFRDDPLFRVMSNTVEGSPYHREQNVGVHTDMVVTQYVGRITCPTDVWAVDDLIGAFACAFHDVGKPSAMQRKYSEARGEYNSFNGHELISARLWEDWAVRNWSRLQAMDLLPYDIYRVGWVIENHLPWGLKDERKLNQVSETVARMFEWPEVFVDVLMADTNGRISDDADEKRAKSEAWAAQFLDRTNALDYDDTVDDSRPVLLMPIATSGSGKSTFTAAAAKEMCGNHYVYSWDQLRLDWYSQDYAEAFQMSVDDKDFMNKAQRAFIDLVKSGTSVVVDNTSGSRKRRRFFIDQAQRHNYRTVAVLLPVDLDTVLDRQETRDDKTVPEEAVRRQYMSLQYPHLGEFDEVIVADWNLPS